MTADNGFFRFPDGFLWGSCIGDYETFGGAECDLPLRQTAKHAEHYLDDVDLISNRLHNNAIRTAIEWARIEPKEGKIDKDAVSFYKNYLSSLKKGGMKVFVSLHDYSNPLWVQEQGGWLSRRVARKFSEFVDLVGREFGDYLDYCIIVNNPASYALWSYSVGSSIDRGLPPYHDDFTEAITCLGNLTDAIIDGSEILHKHTKVKVGLCTYYGAFTPMDPNNSRHRNSADFAEQIFTYQVPDATRSKVDFIGIEYHLRILMAEDNKATQTEFYPKGIRESVKKLYDRYKLPIAILDNGYPTRDDDEKIKFLLEHLKELHDAINVDKINIFAYQWWCAIRGFTWGYGFKPFFALIDVEGEEKDVGGYEDLAGPLKRIMTRAGEYYGSICRDNGFPQSEYEKYRDMKKPLREWVEF